MSGLAGFETQSAASASLTSMSASSLFPQQSLRQLPLRLPLDTNTNFTDFTNSCILQTTGLPRNVTQQELNSLYSPIMHLLSVSLKSLREYLDKQSNIYNANYCKDA